MTTRRNASTTHIPNSEDTTSENTTPDNPDSTFNGQVTVKKPRVRARRGGSSPKDIERWERDYQCVQMRRAEVDWDTIVERLGYSSTGHAHNRFVAFMRAYPRDDVETMRDLELQRIEKTAMALEPRIAAGGPDAVRAAEVWNKLSERRSKLMGLDKPERKEITVLTEDVVDKAIREAQEEMERKAKEAGVAVPELQG
jgi:hypothetical protein